MSSLRYSSLAEIDEIYSRLKKTFKDGKTRPLEYRRRQLLQLARLAQENATALEDAAFTDLGKPRQECATAEVGAIIGAALNAAEHLAEWSSPDKPQVEERRSSWDTTVYKVPKGVALIISPWNYPFVLTFNPLVGAIAAGCPAVLKPSESTPTCSALMKTLAAKYLDPEAYVVVNGAVPETTVLLSHRWGHIFFTGGGKVGKIIATAAAQNLTPVTLELGGKSPVIIDQNCDLELAAKRTLFGKIQNSGQLCVSPDHVYIPRVGRPSLQGSIEKGEILLGGDVDGDKRIAPTIVYGVKPEDALMEQEIFGPLLPLLEVEDVDEAISLIVEQPTPLVIYVFTNNEETKQKFINRTSSGTLVLNDTYIQLSVHEMPFGGHGESGYGAYYGKESFDTFTHRRSYINVPPSAEPAFGARYPPYSDEKYKAMTAVLHAKIPDE